MTAWRDSVGRVTAEENGVREANVLVSSGSEGQEGDSHRRPPPSAEDWETICALLNRFSIKNMVHVREATEGQEVNANLAHRSIGLMMELVAQEDNPFKRSDIYIAPFVVVIRRGIASIRECRAPASRKRVRGTGVHNSKKKKSH